jgi:predicted NAD-dependent protein-ADP-ribosyltransferase YbiA (DUF1768 family)
MKSHRDLETIRALTRAAELPPLFDLIWGTSGWQPTIPAHWIRCTGKGLNLLGFALMSARDNSQVESAEPWP